MMMGAVNSAGDPPGPALAGFYFVSHYKIQILFCRQAFQVYKWQILWRKSRRAQASPQMSCFPLGHPSASEQLGTLPGLPCPLFPMWSIGHLDLCFISRLCYLEEWLGQVMGKRTKAATLSYVIKNEAHISANNLDRQPTLNVFNCLQTPPCAPGTRLEAAVYVQRAIYWEVPQVLLVGWVFTKTHGFLWAAHTICTAVHLERERWAHKGRQILILSPPVNVKFLLEIHMRTPQRETLHTPVCSLDWALQDAGINTTSWAGTADTTFICYNTHPLYHRTKILPTRDAVVIHRHIFYCLLLFSSQHKENHTRSWNQDFPLQS